jgi:co-chaperonin GroES (HSP10)
MKIRPTHDIVVLICKEGEEILPSGIIRPDVDKNEKVVKGEVLATGPGKMNEHAFTFEGGRPDRFVVERMPMSCKKGDVVLFERGIGGGYEITLNGQKLYIVRDVHIVGVLEPS